MYLCVRVFILLLSKILELFRQYGTLELFRQYGILELFRQYGTLELFRQYGIFCFSFYYKKSVKTNSSCLSSYTN